MRSRSPSLFSSCTDMQDFFDKAEYQSDFFLIPRESGLLSLEGSSESSSTIDPCDFDVAPPKRKHTTRKERWTEEEDSLLRELVGKYGTKNWQVVAQSVPGRCGKQCRQRWCNYLDPSIKKRSWTPEEDAILLSLQRKMGNRWSLIKQSFPGRSDNDVKNRYHCIHSRLYSVKQPKMAPSPPMPSSLKPFSSLSCTFQKEIPLSDSFPLCEQFSEQLCEQEPLSFSGSDCFGSSELYDPSSFFTPSVSESCLTGF